jgi:prepilin-type N-terminal cleavage/methylation domain-containing protein
VPTAKKAAKVRMPTSPTEPRGFTLIELCVVVAIIGIFTALVFARLDAAIPRQRLRSAAADVAGAARFARTTARLWRSEVLLEYDLDHGTWAVSAVPPPGENPEEEAETAKSEPEVIFSGSLPEDIKVRAVYYSESGQASSGTVAASFRPSGAVGEHMVVLESESAGALAVYVPALLGTPFLVEDDSSYAQIRAQRRLQ